MFTSVCGYRTGPRIFTAIILCTGALVMSGCASGISDYSRAMVTYQGDFPELQRGPDRHRGKVVMLGGRIVETAPAAAGTEIMVLQLPLGTMDKPALDQASQGRFLIATPEFLDPAAYRKLTLITVVGEVTGHEVRPVGDYAYTLPVLRPIEIKQWASDYGGGQWTGRTPGYRPQYAGQRRRGRFRDIILDPLRHGRSSRSRRGTILYRNRY